MPCPKFSPASSKIPEALLAATRSSSLMWFVQPLFFIATTLVVTFMLYRMEFHSRTLDVLSETTK